MNEVVAIDDRCWPEVRARSGGNAPNSPPPVPGLSVGLVRGLVHSGPLYGLDGL